MTHECKQEEKIDKLIAITTQTHLAICGNGVPGLHDRVTKLENGLIGTATFCIGIGAVIGGAIAWIAKVV